MNPDIRAAVSRAINRVNLCPGKTCVHLWYAGDPKGVDFVANRARLDGSTFEFQAGFERYCGSLEEIAEIRTEPIGD